MQDTMTHKEYMALISELASRTYEMAIYTANRLDALDNSEFVAYELSSLIEWMTPDASCNVAIAKKVIDNHELPKGSAVHLRSYFNLPY